MSESTSTPTPSVVLEKAEATLAAKMTRPIEDMSIVSATVVADAAKAIAKAKAEIAAKALEAAKEALARAAAIKAANAAPQGPARPEPLGAVAAKVAAAFTTSPKPAAEALKVTEIPGTVVADAAKAIAKAKAEFMAQAEAEAAKIEAQQKAIAEQAKAKAAAEAIAKGKAALAKAAETAAAAAEAIARTKAELNAQAEAASAATPEELARFAESIRAANSAKTAHLRRTAPRVPAARPGVPLEPVAHAAGLHAPVHRPKQRKIVTPGLLFLFALMTFFGLYATGNLPQFDRWTDSVVNSAHAHNDQVVTTVVSGWRMIAYGATGLVLLVIVFMIINAVRASHSDND